MRPEVAAEDCRVTGKNVSFSAILRVDDLLMRGNVSESRGGSAITRKH